MAIAIEQTLSERDFKQIAAYIESNVGIKMPETKRLMMQSRLAGRLRALGIPTYREYINYVFSKNGTNQDELVLMIDALTTNLTEFFRESGHFDFMTGTALPALAASGHHQIKLWSAGCSSGEEPYTLSIVMQEFMRNNPGKINAYSVLATDISTKVLNKAAEAVYALDSIKKLPLDMKRRYFLRSKNAAEPKVRVKADVRNRVSFARLNFMDDDFGFRDTMQIIFCRNVLIYFDKPTQEAVIRKFMQFLETGGYLFLGHSETIFGMNLPLKNVSPTVFQKV
ncbi:MAG TPA: protein-glutamate O-methyltransferase [Candidatus Treponema faecavium]|nr:protein-glutamate O-methyltransferase [Candidatus Treponema faecavium]